MTTAEFKKIVTQTIMAQGEIYNYNINNWHDVLGVSTTQIQNAISYFQFSPQQAKFRATYNFH